MLAPKQKNQTQNDFIFHIVPYQKNKIFRFLSKIKYVSDGLAWSGS